jgi:hypothetical protein
MNIGSSWARVGIGKVEAALTVPIDTAGWHGRPTCLFEELGHQVRRAPHHEEATVIRTVVIEVNKPLSNEEAHTMG